MNLNVRDKIIYHVMISGLESARIFETEIHKKKFLDAVEELAGTHIRIYGYCVLDKKAELFCGTDGLLPESCICEIMYRYDEKRRQQAFDLRGETMWTCETEELPSEELWEALLRLHFLPVLESYPVRPEDYWWSSCAELMGRRWMRFQVPKLYMDRKAVRKAHMEWKKQHPELFRKLYRYPVSEDSIEGITEAVRTEKGHIPD